AALGPAFATSMVQARLPPGSTGSGVSAMATDRSVSTPTRTLAQRSLLLALVSGVTLLTWATSSRLLLPGAEGGTNTSSAIETVPGSKAGVVQLVEPVEPTAGVVQVQPGGADRARKVAGEGTWKLTSAPLA